MPKVVIDSKEIEVEQGTRVIEAADRLGIYIPRFCYHKGLSIAANCRMCLVEVKKVPKLLPACHAVCQDGMEVVTGSDRVREVRRAVLEYILLNHPVDCPICDQAGECDLQDLYFQFDLRPSRHFFKKEHKPKAEIFGPQIIYDGERCINCTRCVRFLDEVTRTHELRQVERGGRTYIALFPGKTLDNPYSMCVADLCPVGALTTRDFRFKCRVWFMTGTDSLCGECSRNCAVRVDTFDGAIQRIVPRYNPNVNQWWACDHGRLAYHRFEPQFLARPSRGGTAFEGAPDAAVQEVAKTLTEARDRLLFVLSWWLTNEDAVALLELARGLGAKVAASGRPQGDGDDILIRPDKNPNRMGVSEAMRAFGYEPMEVTADMAEDAAIVVAFGEIQEPHDWCRAENLIWFSPLLPPRGCEPRMVVPLATPYQLDGTWLNEFSVLQRLNPTVPKGEWQKQAFEWAAAISWALGQQDVSGDLNDLFKKFASVAMGLETACIDHIDGHGIVVAPQKPQDATGSP